MFGLTNRGELDPVTEHELENFYGRLKRLWLTEHNEDGTHQLLDADYIPVLTPSHIPDLDASKIISGTLADARLSANVALRNAANVFSATGNQFAEILAVNKGLQFPAIRVTSADPNALDDYEEGTWVPVIGGSGGTSGQTYAVQVGSYTKVGKLVIAFFTAVLTNKGTITSNVIISGLPFTVENTTNLYSVGAMQWSGLATNWVNIIAVVNPNTNNATVRGATAAGPNNITDLVTADINNATTFVGTLLYQAT